MDEAGSLLQVRDLRTYFLTADGIVKAVDGVSFDVDAGETMGLVGESGCGKSMTCHSIIRMVPQPAGRIVGGQVLFEGRDILRLSERQMREYRGKSISMVLQDPMTSLDPVYTVGEQVAEAIRTHQRIRRSQVRGRVASVLGSVSIPSPEVRMREYPHQMSGGMRQRISIGMVISCQPKLLLADEPTTALDVSVQAQILALLKTIQDKSGIAMIVVTHDLGIVARVCSKVAVMYAGRIVEKAPVRELFRNPVHPYTLALMKSVPRLGKRAERLYSIPGQPPNLSRVPGGCYFAPRCSIATEVCREEYPPEQVLNAEHITNCWHV